MKDAPSTIDYRNIVTWSTYDIRGGEELAKVLKISQQFVEYLLGHFAFGVLLFHLGCEMKDFVHDDQQVV